MWNITTQINTYGLLDFEQLCFLNIFVRPLSTVTNLKLLEMKYEKEKKLNWVIYYKNLANYEASHAKMSSSIKSIRLTYMSNMKSGKISIP